MPKEALLSDDSSLAHQQPTLVVDMDGTLIRTDMLYETFWSAFSRNLATPLLSVQSLLKGRAALKGRLANLSQIDPTTLPIREEVVAYVKRWKDNGGRTVLATASNQSLANLVADHLGIFDTVHGSTETVNLKSEAKAALLQSHYGTEGFYYIGDSVADLPVWSKSRRAIVINPSARLLGELGKEGVQVESLTTETNNFGSFIKTIRPHQWLKNLLVFLPLLAAHNFTGDAILRATLAFIAFCLVASSVYVLNDLLDLGPDRAHRRKRHRPLASGKMSVSQATWIAPLLLIAGLAVGSTLGFMFTSVLGAYYVITLLYSFVLKRRIVIDICALAGLYTIRIVAGGVATNIVLSVWLLAFSIFIFFSLAAVKRQAELVAGVATGEVTAHGRGYHVDDLPLVAMFATASGYLSVLVLALYVNTPSVLSLYSSPTVLLGICLVLLYWVTRMVMVTHRGRMTDDPIVFAAKDRISQLCLLLIAGLVVAGTIL